MIFFLVDSHDDWLIFAQLERLEGYRVYEGKVDIQMHGKCCHKYLLFFC